MHCILCTVQLKGIEKQGHCVHFVRIVLPGKGIVLQRKGIVCAFSKSSSARWPLLQPRAVAAGNNTELDDGEDDDDDNNDDDTIYGDDNEDATC